MVAVKQCGAGNWCLLFGASRRNYIPMMHIQNWFSFMDECWGLKIEYLSFSINVNTEWRSSIQIYFLFTNTFFFPINSPFSGSRMKTQALAQLVKNQHTIQETWVGKLPWRRKSILQYSGLENSMDCIGHGIAKSRTWLSDFHIHTYMTAIGSVLNYTQIFYFLCKRLERMLA